MRILALAEMPDEWDRATRHWSNLNNKFLRRSGDARAPSAGHEYMLYQALIGAWPHSPPDDAFAERMRQYALKAAREGKQETSWTNPNAEYEAALMDFVTAALDPARSKDFIESFEQFARRSTLLGALNSLSQLTLKFTLPGVPDIYRGTELWDLSLVDPDNRRPVDYDERRALLFEKLRLDDANSSWRDGRIKFHLMLKLLQLRRRHADLFAEGDYTPLEVTGPDAPHIVAFSRRYRARELVVIAGRHFGARTDLGKEWPRNWNFALCEKRDRYIDALRERTISAPEASRLFDDIPAAVLIPC
jgi:(1->4)-alpha-D-glucan 1-alpha-D-glucosylmutase